MKWITIRFVCAWAVWVLGMGSCPVHAAPAVNSVDYPAKVSIGLSRPDRLSLDGSWQFQTDPQDLGLQEGWQAGGKITQRSLQVPLPWQLAAEDLRPYYGVAWYETACDVPADYAGRRLTLGFEGVGHHATVYVNGQLAGEHTGLQAPFALDVTALLHPGAKNTVTLRIFEPQSGTSIYMDSHSLLRVSGLWRGVWLEATGKTFISDLFMIPDIDHNRATARVTVCIPPADQPGELQLNIKLTGPDMRSFVGQSTIAFPALDIASTSPTFQTVELPIEIPNAQLWDTEHPNLYSIEAHLAQAAASLDTVTDRFGMRKIEARNGRFYLNNEVFYLIGGGIDPLPYGGSGDVNWFLPGPYAYPSDAETAEDIRKIKSLGVNFVRIPLRPMHKQWLRLADEMGLLVWQEASWTRFEDLKGWRDTWSECLLRDRNHPSVVLWTLFNESWGFEFVNAIYDHVKQLDPTRLVLDNTGGASLGQENFPGNHQKTDLEDVHNYPGFNDFPRDYWRGLRRVDPDHPLLVSEFGPMPYMFNVAKFRKLWGGQDPWWVHSGRASVDDPTKDVLHSFWNHLGFEQRYNDWGMKDIYGDWDAFITAHDWYYFWALKCQMQWIRTNDEIGGFVAWIWDNGQHGTGAIDNFKNVKVYGTELGKIWTQDLLIVDELRHNYWSGDRVNANLYLSHFSAQDFDASPASAEWSLENYPEIQGKFNCLSVPVGHTQIVGQIQFDAPQLDQSAMLKIQVRLKDASGKTLSENYEPIWIFPRSFNHASPRPITLIGTAAFNTMNLYGYKFVQIEEQPALVITDEWTAPVEDYVRQGGTAICYVTTGTELLKRNDLRVTGPRLGGHTDSFYARKTTGIFEHIPYENPYLWQFQHMWAKACIDGINPADHPDILAGAYINLLNTQVATMIQYKLGQGRVILMTHDMMKVLHNDPVALIVMNDLIEYATSDFQPKAELK